MGILGLPEASTVIPVRQGAGGLEVYLVRRSDRSGFMAGHYVFPGGVVDPADRDVRLWAGAIDLNPTALAEKFGEGLSWQQAVAFGVAAIRETFEEAGVFLGDPRGPEQLARVLGHRRDGVLSREWLSEEAATGAWKLAFSSLSCWAWWVTPEGMKRRYDTRFFVAPFPSDQECSPDGTEVVEGVWTTPRRALEANLTAERPLAPPLVVTLHDLLRFDDAESFLAVARARTWGAAIAPRLVTFPGGQMLLEPWDPRHGETDPGIDVEALPQSVLPAGEPFSRLWNDGRAWRPVRANP